MTYYRVSTGTGYSLTSGGTGDQTPTAGDLVIVDGNSGNWTLGASIGSYAYDGSGNYTGTAGLLGIVLDASFTGTFDANDFDLCLGASGLSASAASAATINMGAGRWATTGFVLNSATTLNKETSSILFHGGTSGSRNQIYTGGKSLRNIVFAAGSYSHVIGSNITDDGSTDYTHNWGSLLLSNTTTAFFRTIGYYQHAGAETLAAGTGASIVINNKALFADDADDFQVRLSCYGGDIDCNSGTFTQQVTFANYIAATTNIGSSVRLTDLVFSRAGTLALSIVFADNPIYGNITSTGSTGTISASGRLLLSGTADQSIGLGGLTTSPTFVDGGKSAGDVDVVSGAVTVASGDYLNLRAGSVALSATVTGAGEVGISPGFTNSGTFTPAILRLVDWDATAPYAWSGAIVFETSAVATGDITPALSGSYDWTDVQFTTSGDNDLVIDCTSVTEIAASGDVSASRTGAGKIRWIRGNETLLLDGSGDQTLDLGDLEPGSLLIGEIDIDNTGGTVTIAADVWTDAYVEAVAATVVNPDYIHIASESVYGGSVSYGEVYCGGAQDGDVFISGAQYGEVFCPGAQLGQVDA